MLLVSLHGFALKHLRRALGIRGDGVVKGLGLQSILFHFADGRGIFGVSLINNVGFFVKSQDRVALGISVERALRLFQLCLGALELIFKKRLRINGRLAAPLNARVNEVLDDGIGDARGLSRIGVSDSDLDQARIANWLHL